MKHLFFAFCLLLFAVSSVTAQVTKINAPKLVAPSTTTSQFLITNGSGNTVWANAATLLAAGTGISISGNTITNSAPDQTVSITNGGGIAVTGSYPAFTLTATDQSTTNEIQTISAGDGTGSDRTISLSLSGGTVTIAQGAGIALSRSGNTITVASTYSLPTVTLTRYEEVIGTATSTVTVTGFTPLAADTFITVDGVVQDIGSGEDVTIAGSVLTFSQQLAVAQKVVVRKITLN